MTALAARKSRFPRDSRVGAQPDGAEQNQVTTAMTVLPVTLHQAEFPDLAVPARNLQ